MTLELAVVSDDLSSVLLNLNGLGQGNPTGFEVKEWNLGQVTPEMELASNPAYPGAVQTVVHHPPVDMELTLQAVSTSYDALRDLVGSLVSFLREGGFMRYKLDGQTNYHYIEYFGSQLPQLMRGENDVTQKYIVERFQDLTGVPFVIKRQPYVFRATRNVVDAFDIRNDNFGDSMTVSASVVGDLPALAKVSVQVPAGSAEVVHMRVGRKSTGDLSEYQGNYIRYTVSPLTGLGQAWKKLHKQVFTPTTSSSLEGTYRVFVSLRLDSEDEYHFQLRWGTVNAEPAGLVNDEVDLDSADTSAMNQFADISLGIVRFDSNCSALVLEIWGRVENGGTVTFNDVWLQPIEEQALTLTSPGFRFGRFGREVYRGNEMTLNVGPVLDEDDRVILESIGDTCSTANQNLPVGMHLLQFIGTVINWNRTRAQIGKIEVLENGSADASRRVKLTSRRKRSRVHYDHDNPKQVSWKVTDTTKNYKFQVEKTASFDGHRVIKVNRLIHSYVPIVGNMRQFVIDGIGGEAYIADDLGSRFFPAHLTGPFITLEPGENILVFRLGDANQKPVFREVDSRGHLPELITTRTALVTIDVRERFIV